MKTIHFRTPRAFRSWLEKHHAKSKGFWLRFYLKASAKGGITYFEALDQALCFGWIDGLRKSFDPQSYIIRFTPRKLNSIWSGVNIKKYNALLEAGHVRAAGAAAFGRRDPKRSRIYSYEMSGKRLTPGQVRRFKANTTAWAFYQSQAPWYQRVSTHWVATAKKAETQERRIATLILDSAAGRRIKPLNYPKKRT